MRSLISDKNIQFKQFIYLFVYIIGIFIIQGCTSVSSFPSVARAGDTISLMVGGSEDARKETISVSLTDSNGQVWDLQALGLIRSVFNLRTDARANGMHYSAYLESYISWELGHEPVQTVLVVDIPQSAAIGNAVISVGLNVNDNSGFVGSPFDIKLEVISGAGIPDKFLRQNVSSSPPETDFTRLEPAPHGKINFGVHGNVVIGAVSLVVDFNDLAVNPEDINVYVPEATVRGGFSVTGKFGEKQRMVYWRQDGQQLYIDVIAPQGIHHAYLMMYLIHPDGLLDSVNFNITSSRIYDVNGNELSLVPTLEYFP